MLHVLFWCGMSHTVEIQCKFGKKYKIKRTVAVSLKVQIFSKNTRDAKKAFREIEMFSRKTI